MKHYAIIKGLVANFQQAWSGYLGKAISSDLVCFSSEKFLFSGHQMKCRSSQGLTLSLCVSCKSKSLDPRVWQHKGWLPVPYKSFSNKVEEHLSGGVFSNRQNLQVARCDA